MKVAVGCDHGGFVLKDTVISTLERLGAEVVDLGCFSQESVDYPSYGFAVANAVATKQCDMGVVMCGTGIGISISANKVKGVRCALCTDEYMAQMTRRHNDANVLAMGGRVISCELAQKIVEAWYTTPFEGGRHQRRVDLISQHEDECFK